MPMEMYIAAGESHTKEDKEVDDKFVKETQKKINGHVSMWIKATDMGGDWKHGERHRLSQIGWSCLVPPMYLVVKDHKSHDPDSDDPPPTRPICGAVNSMNVNLSNIISTFIEAIADEMEEKAEVISTEDSLSRIDQFNSNQESKVYNCEQATNTHCNDEFVTEDVTTDGQSYKFVDVLDEILAEDWEANMEENFDTLEDSDIPEIQTEEIVIAGSDVNHYSH